MAGPAGSRAVRGGVLALVGALALAPTAAAQDATTDPVDDGRLTLRDTLYLLPLGSPAATPECLLILCPIVQPFAPVGAGPDAGVSGLRVSSLPLAPPGVVAESRSEPLPYDGAGPRGTASLSLRVDRSAEGSGGTVTTAVRLEQVGGGTVAEFPASTVPLDGQRRTLGPIEIDPARMPAGRSYVAVARFVFSVPPGGAVGARVFAPKLLALGPKRAVAAPKPLKPRKPVVRLEGRRLQVTARCPTGGVGCEVRVRAALSGRTLGKGSADLQAAARHTFTYVLSAAELRRARRVGAITTTLRVEDGNGRVGSSRASLRLPRR